METLEAGLGSDIVVWFQGLGRPVLGYLLAPFHFVGGQYGYLVVLPVIYWAVSKRDGKRLMILALGSALVGQYLKALLARPRPVAVSPDRVTPIFEQSGYGIPSGHTIFGVVIGGYLWHRFPRPWIRVAAVLFALLMGVSRMVHGVHFPQDVIAGLLVGLVLILVFLWIDGRFSQSIQRWSLSLKVAVFAAVGVAGFVLVQTTSAPHAKEDLLAVVGALVGAGIGFAIEHEFVGFASAGRLGQRVLRVVVGSALIVGVFFGLEILYEDLIHGAYGVGAQILDLLRYAIVGAVVTAGAPYLFLVLHLANKES